MSENRSLKIYSYISIALFMAVLILPTAIWGIGKLLPGNPIDVLNYDLGENRNFAKFPTEFTPTIGTELETFYNDHLPFRSVIISANRKVTATTEKPYDNIISPFLVKMFYSQPSSSESASDTDKTNKTDETASNVPMEYLPPKVHNNLTIEGRDGWLFLGTEENLNDYLGNNILTDEELETYLSKMVKLDELCKAQGKELYFFIPPNKTQVYPEKMPSYTIIDKYTRVQHLVDYVQANSDIKIAYPLQELLAAKEDMQIYLKTDTHWNEAGAYIGTQALYSLMGMPTTDIQDVDHYEKEFTEGDLIRMGNLNPEDFPPDTNFEVNYKMDVSVTELDGTDITQWLYKTSSTSENDCNFLIAGDSYRLFMTKYLNRDFSSFNQIHTDSVGEPEVESLLENADIIVIESVERFNYTLLNTMDHFIRYLED